ncbi:MAG: hypothetical protein OHK0028_12680 [Deltaproteobacteria bacterium]
MNGHRRRPAGRRVIALLCAACFAVMSLGSATRAAAADEWPVWPKKAVEPGVEPKPAPEPNGAAKAGDAAGKKASDGMSAGTIGWIAAGAAAVIGIAVAAGGGGGGSSSNCNQSP